MLRLLELWSQIGLASFCTFREGSPPGKMSAKTSRGCPTSPMGGWWLDKEGRAARTERAGEGRRPTVSD